MHLTLQKKNLDTNSMSVGSNAMDINAMRPHDSVKNYEILRNSIKSLFFEIVEVQ